MSVNYITSEDNKLYQITWDSVSPPKVKVYNPEANTGLGAYETALTVQNAIRLYFGTSSTTHSFRGMQINPATSDSPQTVTIVYSSGLHSYQITINASDTEHIGKPIGIKETLPLGQFEGVKEYRQGANGSRVYFTPGNTFYRLVLSDGTKTKINTGEGVLDVKFVSDKLGARIVWALNKVGQIEVSHFDSSGKLLSTESRAASAAVNAIGTQFIALHTDQKGRVLALDKSGFLHVFSEANGVSGYYKSASAMITGETLIVGKHYRMALQDDGHLLLSGGKKPSDVVRGKNVATLIAVGTKEYLFDTVTLGEGDDKQQFRTEDGVLYSRKPGQDWIPQQRNGYVSQLTYNQDGSAIALSDDNTLLHIKPNGDITSIDVSDRVSGHLRSATISGERLYFIADDGQIYFQGLDGAEGSKGAFDNNSNHKFSRIVARDGSLYTVTEKGAIAYVNEPLVGETSASLDNIRLIDTKGYTDVRLGAGTGTEKTLLFNWKNAHGEDTTYLGKVFIDGLKMSPLINGPVIGHAVGEQQPIVTGDGRQYVLRDGRVFYLQQKDKQWVPTHTDGVLKLKQGADGKLYVLHENGKAISRLNQYGELEVLGGMTTDPDTGEITVQGEMVTNLETGKGELLEVKLLLEKRVSDFTVGPLIGQEGDKENALTLVGADGSMDYYSVKETAWGGAVLGPKSLAVSMVTKGSINGQTVDQISNDKGFWALSDNKVFFKAVDGEWQQQNVPEGTIDRLDLDKTGKVVISYANDTQAVFDKANWLSVEKSVYHWNTDNGIKITSVSIGGDGKLHSMDKAGKHRVSTIDAEGKFNGNFQVSPSSNLSISALETLQDGIVIGRDINGNAYQYSPGGVWASFIPNNPASSFNHIFDYMKQRQYSDLSFNLPFRKNNLRLGAAQEGVSFQRRSRGRLLSLPSLKTVGGSLLSVPRGILTLANLQSNIDFFKNTYKNSRFGVPSIFKTNSNYQQALDARNGAWKVLAKHQSFDEYLMSLANRDKFNDLKTVLDGESSKTIKQINELFGTKKSGWKISKPYLAMQAFRKKARFGESNAIKTLVRVRMQMFGEADPITQQLQGLLDAGVYLPKYGSDLDVAIAKLALEQQVLIDAHKQASLPGSPLIDNQQVTQKYYNNPVKRIHSTGTTRFSTAKKMLADSYQFNSDINNKNSLLFDALSVDGINTDKLSSHYQHLLSQMSDGQSATFNGVVADNASTPSFRYLRELTPAAYVLAGIGFNVGREKIRRFTVTKSGDDTIITQERIVSSDIGTSFIVDAGIGAGMTVEGAGLAVYGDLIVSGKATRKMSWGNKSTYTVKGGDQTKLDNTLQGLMGGEWDSYQLMANSDEIANEKSYSSNTHKTLSLGIETTAVLSNPLDFDAVSTSSNARGAPAGWGAVRMSGFGNLDWDSSNTDTTKYQDTGSYGNVSEKSKSKWKRSFTAFAGLISRMRVMTEHGGDKANLFDTVKEKDGLSVTKTWAGGGATTNSNYSAYWDSNGIINQVEWTLETTRNSSLTKNTVIRDLLNSGDEAFRASFKEKLVNMASFMAADTRQTIKATLVEMKANGAGAWVDDLIGLSDFTNANDRKNFRDILKQNAKSPGQFSADISALKSNTQKKYFRADDTVKLTLRLSGEAILALEGITDQSLQKEKMQELMFDTDNHRLSEMSVADSVSNSSSIKFDAYVYTHEATASMTLSKTLGKISVGYTNGVPDVTATGELMTNNTAEAMAAHKKKTIALERFIDELPVTPTTLPPEVSKRLPTPADLARLIPPMDLTDILSYNEDGTFDSSSERIAEVSENVRKKIVESFSDSSPNPRTPETIISDALVTLDGHITNEQSSALQQLYRAHFDTYQGVLIKRNPAELLHVISGRVYYDSPNGLLALSPAILNSLIVNPSNAETLFDAMSHPGEDSVVRLADGGLTQDQITDIENLSLRVESIDNPYAIKSKRQAYDILSLVSLAREKKPLTDLQKVILGNHFPPVTGEVDGNGHPTFYNQSAVEQLNNSAKNAEFRNHVTLLLQNLDAFTGQPDGPANASEAIEKLLSWDAITEEGGENLHKIVDGIDSTYDAKTQIAPQSFFVGLGENGHPKGMCGGLGAAYLAALAQGNKNAFINGIFTYGTLKQLASEGRATALEAGQASDFHSLIGDMNEQGSINAGTQDSVMNSVENLSLSQVIDRLTGSSGDKYLQINTGNHALFLAKKTIDGSTRLYFYDPNFGESSIAINNMNETKVAFNTLINDHLNQTSEKGLWNGTLAEYYQANSDGADVSFNAYEMDASKLADNQTFNDMNSLLNVDGFQTEYQRLAALPDITINGKAISPQLLYAMGATIDGKLINTLDMADVEWFKKVVFDASKLNKVIDKTDSVDVLKALHVLRQVNGSSASLIQNDVETLDYKKLLARLDEIGSFNDFNDPQKTADLFFGLKDGRSNVDTSGSLSKVTNKMSTGTDRFDKYQSMMGIINYVRRDGTNKLSAKHKMEADVGLGLTLGGLALDLGGNTAVKGFVKLGIGIRNRFTSTASKGAVAAKSFKDGLVKAGNAIVGLIGAGFDIYGAYAAFSQLNDPNLSEKARQDLLVAGGLSVAGAVTGLATVAAVAASVSYAGPIGAIAGVALMLGGGIYSAVREIQDVKKYVDLTTGEEFINGLRSFLSLGLTNEVIDDLEYAKSKELYKESSDEYIHSEALQLLDIADEVIYSTGSEVEAEFDDYYHIVEVRYQNEYTNWVEHHFSYEVSDGHFTGKFKKEQLSQAMAKAYEFYNQNLQPEDLETLTITPLESVHKFYKPGDLISADETYINIDDHSFDPNRTSDIPGSPSLKIMRTTQHIWNSNGIPQDKLFTYWLTGEGDDTIIGRKGKRNLFNIVDGKKYVKGGDQDDVFSLSPGNDNGDDKTTSFFYGGGGVDTLVINNQFASGQAYKTDLTGGLSSQPRRNYYINGIENVVGSEKSHDYIIGNDDNNMLDGRGIGGAVNNWDILEGNGGDDVLVMHDRTTASGGSGNDTFIIADEVADDPRTIVIWDDNNASEISTIILGYKLSDLDSSNIVNGADLSILIRGSNNGRTYVLLKDVFEHGSEKRTHRNYRILTKDGFELTPATDKSKLEYGYGYSNFILNAKYNPASSQLESSDRFVDDLSTEKKSVDVVVSPYGDIATSQILNVTGKNSVGEIISDTYELPPWIRLSSEGTSGDDFIESSWFEDQAIFRGFAGDDTFKGSYEEANTYIFATDMNEVKNESLSTEQFILTDTGNKYIKVTSEEPVTPNSDDESTVSDDESTVSDDESTVSDDESTVSDDGATVSDDTAESAVSDLIIFGVPRKDMDIRQQGDDLILFYSPEGGTQSDESRAAIIHLVDYMTHEKKRLFNIVDNEGVLYEISLNDEGAPYISDLGVLAKTGDEEVDNGKTVIKSPSHKAMVFGDAADDYFDVIGMNVDGGYIFEGGDGDDTLNDNVGDNILSGGSGDDTFNLSGGEDIILTGSGDDRVVLANSSLSGLTVIDTQGLGQKTIDTPYDINDPGIIRGRLDNNLVILWPGSEDNGIAIVDYFIDLERHNFKIGQSGGPYIEGDELWEWSIYEEGSLYADEIYLSDLNFPTNNTFNALDDDDIIYDSGSTTGRILYGDGGDDSIYAGDGDDIVYGGSNNDFTAGDNGSGDDYATLGAGNDIFDDNAINSGDDEVYGGLGSDIIYTGDGDDFLSGGAGEDELYGENGDDVLIGGMGDDSIVGDSGNDFLDGGSGNDNLDGGHGNDTLFGGAGDDTLKGDGNIEQVVQTSADIRLQQDSPIIRSFDFGIAYAYRRVNIALAAQTLGDWEGIEVSKNNQDNFYVRADGVELLKRSTTGLDSHMLTATLDSNGQISLEFEADSSTADEQIDLTNLSLSLNYDDVISGGDGNDTLYGNHGNDILDGGVGDDDVYGGDGDDTIYYSGGTDILDGGDGQDTLSFERFTPPSFVLSGNLEDLISTDLYGPNFIINTQDYTGFETVIGSDGNDTLIGNNQAEKLSGGRGHDLMMGDKGNDILEGNDGDDSLYGGDGNDTLLGGEGDDELHGDLDRITRQLGTDLSLLQDSPVNQVFSFGSQYAGQRVTIILDAHPLGDWEVSGDHVDHFRVSSNGILLLDKSETELMSYTLETILDSKGDLSLAFEANTTNPTETLDVSNLVVIVEPALTHKHGSNMVLEKDTAVSETFSFGAQFAGRTVTIALDAETLGDWEGSVTSWDPNGLAIDYFNVRVNNVELLNRKDAGLQRHTLAATLDSSGQITIEFEADSTTADEKIDLTNLVVIVEPVPTHKIGSDVTLVIDIPVSQTFSFGAEFAGRTVTIALDAESGHGWDESGIYQDFFYVRADGTELLKRSETGLKHHTFEATLDSLGQVTVELEADMTNSAEAFSVKNMSVSINYDDVLMGGAGNDQLYGDLGNDSLDGGIGNDTLSGGKGADTFVFGEGGGTDVITDADTSDIVQFGSGVDADEIWFSRNGDDLLANLLGSNDSITLDDWYLDTGNQVASFELADGTQLLSANIPSLVTAMSSWTAVSGNSVGDLGTVPNDVSTLQVALVHWQKPAA